MLITAVVVSPVLVAAFEPGNPQQGKEDIKALACCIAVILAP